MQILTPKDFGLPEAFFSFLSGPIQYEGRKSRARFAFKQFNPDDSWMTALLAFAMAFWHTMCSPLADMFGEGTATRPYGPPKDVEEAKLRIRCAYYIAYVLRIRFICFHDYDIVPYGANVAEFERNLHAVVPLMKELSALTGIKIGWATQNLFTPWFYLKGAATGTHPLVFAHACAQTKVAMDVGKELGALNHVFWGGREGYNDLLATMMKREKENLARLLQMAVDYKHAIGADVQLLIEPKPMEPTRHQYDASAEVVLGFLLRYGLESEFKLNVEVNHAQLRGLTIEHELEAAFIEGAVGGIDANQGTPGNGWDTDEFPTDINLVTRMMLPVVKYNGIGRGVINFDAKPRRESFDLPSLIEAHVVGQDVIAHATKAARYLLHETEYSAMVEERYSGWNSEFGREIENDEHDLISAGKAAYERQPTPDDLGSSRLERLNFLINEAIVEGGIAA